MNATVTTVPALAWLATPSATSSTTSETASRSGAPSPDTQRTMESGGLSTGAKTGIGVGSAVGAVVVIFGMWKVIPRAFRGYYGRGVVAAPETSVYGGKGELDGKEVALRFTELPGIQQVLAELAAQTQPTELPASSPVTAGN